MPAADGDPWRGLPGRLTDLAALLLGVVLLGFAVARAVLVPITHDEAFTYLHWVSSPWRAILWFEGPERANNHLLNTALTKLSSALFGPREAALRLPNLVAFAAYLCSLWLLLRRRATPLLALSGFLLASANRHVLEMFSLARGYGLSLGLVLTGLVFAARFIEESGTSRRDEILALALVALSVFAQFVMLDVFAALAVVHVTIHGARAKGESSRLDPVRFARRLVPLATTSTLLALLLGGILRTIRESGGFYAGGASGLWHDTTENLVWLTLIPAPWADALTKPVSAVVGALLLFLCAAGARLWVRDARTPRERLALAFIACLALVVVAVELQHVLLGLRYPTDRIATLFIPLFVLAATFTAATAPGAARKVISGVLCLLALGSSAHLVRFGETRRSALWWLDADVRRAVADMGSYARREALGRPLRVASISHCEPALNYERVIGGFAWLAPVERVGTSWDYDLYYVTKAEEEAAARWGFRVLCRYPDTGNLLFLPP